MGPRSGIRKKPIPDPGSRGQKGTGSWIRNTGIRSRIQFKILMRIRIQIRGLKGGGGGWGRSAKNVHPPWQNPRYAPAYQHSFYIFIDHPNRWFYKQPLKHILFNFFKFYVSPEHNIPLKLQESLLMHTKHIRFGQFSNLICYCLTSENRTRATY